MNSTESLMRLYQFEECPYCAMVRRKLTELGITYVNVNVPKEREKRHEVVAVSGQQLVPVLVDGDVVLSDENEIIDYLERTYGPGAGDRG